MSMYKTFWLWIFVREILFSPHSVFLRCVAFCMFRRKIMNQDYMKTKPILPLVLSMSLPMVLSMLVNSLYNIVDSFFVARISENAMNALSLVFPIQNLITAIAVGFGVVMNAVIAFYLGTEDHKKAEDSMAQGLLLSAIHGIILMVVCVVFIPNFL